MEPTVGATKIFVENIYLALFQNGAFTIYNSFVYFTNINECWLYWYKLTGGVILHVDNT